MAAEPQPDHDPAIQSFLAWKDDPKTARTGYGTSNYGRPPYIPINRLKGYLTVRKVKSLLKALFPNETRPISANQIHEDYLRPFAILLSAGNGRMIYQFLKDGDLRDQYLPFRSRPPGFPRSTMCDLWTDFDTHQWIFCPATLKFGKDHYFDSRMPLPISHKEECKRGGSAILYKIEIDKTYNKLIPSRFASAPEAKNTFAMKTYQSSGAEKYYSTEVDGFERLGANSDIISGIVGYYGGFRHNDTYNIILEWADRGTLEDYMRTNVPPSSGKDIIDFWETIFNTVYGLNKIHHTTEGESSILNGWHQDVKPTNILVFSRDSSSTYRSQFKLADLGLSHFRRTVGSRSAPVDRDTWGTYTYGAPETLRNIGASGKINLNITQSIDIWSLGCVYSELAVWLSFGWNSVLEYRRRRASEARRSIGNEHGSLFHDGNTALDTVVDIHKQISIQQESNVDDHITIKVLELVSDMLQEDPDARPTTRQLSNRCHRLVRHAQEKLGLETHDNEQISEPLMTPHNIPPDIQLKTRYSYPSKPHHQGTDPINNTPSQRQRDSDLSNTSNRQPKCLETAIPSQHLQSQIPTIETSGSPRQPLQGNWDQTSPTAAPQVTNYKLAHSTMTVRQGLEIKQNNKKSRMKRRWPGDANLVDLGHRDHVFILDNTESMKVHRKTIIDIIELLPYMLKNSDPDGIDMHFTKSSRQLKSKKKTKALIEAVKEERFVGTSNIAILLNQIFEDYKAKLSSGPQPSHSFFRRTYTTRRPRPLNVYTLTDGMWEPRCDIEPIIRALVMNLRERGLPKDQIGIQFIRFGDEREGKEKLEHLDSGLDLEFDIVDTTHCTENVWKMLMGSTNPWYDDDPN